MPAGSGKAIGPGLENVRVLPTQSELGSARRVLAVASIALALGGCLAERPNATFDLAAAQGFQGRAASGKGVLVVAEPTAIQTIDSQSMVVRSGDQVSYVPGSQWSDRLPKLLQTRIVQSFENAGRIGSVGRSDDRLSGDYQLLTDIRTFEINAGGGAQARVEIAAKIVSTRDGRVLSGRVFSAQAPAGGAINGSSASSSLDRALSQVLSELVGWASGIV